MKSNDLTILFLSCDKYSDLWKPLFYCFHTYWPDCPYPLVLGSNTIRYRDSKIKTLLSGPDKDWSSSLRNILKEINTKYVFIWLDDIFPIQPVVTKDFIDALRFLDDHNGVHMHAWPTPKPDRLVTGYKYGEYDRGTPYRANAFGFWDTAYLRTLLLAGENPWNFEIMGSYRASFTDGFYCCLQTLFHRLHVVEKGAIFSNAYEYCRNHGIPLDDKSRKIISGNRSIQSELQKIYFNIVMKISWRNRVNLMNTLRRLIISY